MRLGITRQGAQQRWGDTPNPSRTPAAPRLTGLPVTRPGPMLALMPGTRTAPGTGANTGPRIHPQLADERIFAGLHHAGYDAWLDHVWHAAACTRPIRLRGDIQHIDPATGELLRTIPTIGMPDGVIYKPCGNRRATTCPGCAETYRRDAYQLIRAGLIGGKGITPDVAGHPAVFVTFTAPSFGPVHARPVRQHTCTDKTRCTCQPQPCHARRDAATCEHGRPAACFTRHRRDDSRLGQPLCPDCYDYAAHVVWNNQRRRTMAAHQASHRTPPQPARPPPRRPRSGFHATAIPPVDPVRVAHGKAAEYQARGAVHFHALLRLDGYDPAHPDRLLPPPPGITIADLDDATRRAAAAISYRTPPHPAQPGGWTITWGTEIDIRVITLHGTGDHHRPGRRQLPGQILHQGHRSHRPRLRPHHRRHPRPVRQPGRHPPRTAHRTPAGASALTPAMSACAAGRTCSASAATS